MNPRDSILMEYSDLIDGTTLSSQDCPSCLGGVKSERSMSVGNSDGLLWWRCHRSSCGFSGGHRLGYSPQEVSGNPRKAKKARVYTRQSLPEDVALMLAERWSVSPETFAEQRWSYTPDFSGHGRRVIMPVRDPAGRMRGYVFRSYWGDEPKAFTEYIEDRGSGMAWCRATAFGKTLVIVEDLPSAHRLMCAGVDAVALLGTTVDNERINEMRQAGFTRLVLSLDQDATEKSIAMVLSLNAVGVLTVKPLEDADIKDMTPEQFSEYIGGIRSMN